MKCLQSTYSAAVCQDKKCSLFWPCFTWPGGADRSGRRKEGGECVWSDTSFDSGDGLTHC